MKPDSHRRQRELLHCAGRMEAGGGTSDALVSESAGKRTDSDNTERNLEARRRIS